MACIRAQVTFWLAEKVVSCEASIRLPTIKLMVRVAEISYEKNLLEPLFITMQVMTLEKVEELFSAKKVPLESYSELLYSSRSQLARQMMEGGRALVPLLFPLAGDMEFLSNLPNFRPTDGHLNLEKMNLMMTVLLRLYCGNRDFLSLVLGRAALSERVFIPSATSPSTIDRYLELVEGLEVTGNWINRIVAMAGNLPPHPK